MAGNTLVLYVYCVALYIPFPLFNAILKRFKHSCKIVDKNNDDTGRFTTIFNFFFLFQSRFQHTVRSSSGCFFS